MEGALRVRTLAKVLAESIATTYFDGFLVDGGGCSYAPAKTVARAFVRAMRLSRAEPTPAAPPPDADETWEAPKEEEGAFVLQGGKKLAVVSLAVEDDVAGRREKAKKEADAEAAWGSHGRRRRRRPGGGGGEGARRRWRAQARQNRHLLGSRGKSSDEAQAEETSEPPYEFEAAVRRAAPRADRPMSLLPLFGAPPRGTTTRKRP